MPTAASAIGIFLVIYTIYINTKILLLQHLHI